MLNLEACSKLFFFFFKLNVTIRDNMLNRSTKQLSNHRYLLVILKYLKRIRVNQTATLGFLFDSDMSRKSQISKFVSSASSHMPRSTYLEA